MQGEVDRAKARLMRRSWTRNQKGQKSVITSLLWSLGSFDHCTGMALCKSHNDPWGGPYKSRWICSGEIPDELARRGLVGNNDGITVMS